MKKQIDQDYVELLFEDIPVEFDMVTTFTGDLPDELVYTRSKDTDDSFSKKLIVRKPNIPLPDGINDFKSF